MTESVWRTVLIGLLLLSALLVYDAWRRGWL